MKIGVLIESFKTDFSIAVEQASRLGVQGIQAYADTENIHAGMSSRRIKELKEMVFGAGLHFSALCGDFGCRMFYRPDECREMIEKEKRILELAKEFGTDIVTTHIGVIPQEKNCVQYESMFRVCRELAEFADSIQGHFAVETGPEPSARLKLFLDELHSRGVGVNLDPANLIMAAGDDPVQAVYNLKEYIVHTHAKDGIRLRDADTRRIYAAEYFNLPAETDDCYREMPLGEGGVDWTAYIGALKDIGFDGYLTIEREVGEDPSKDIGMAAAFLKKLI